MKIRNLISWVWVCEYKNLKIVGKILKSINSKNSSENLIISKPQNFGENLTKI